MARESTGFAFVVGFLVVLTVLGAWTTATGGRLAGFESVVIAAALVFLILRAFTGPVPLDLGATGPRKRPEARLGCSQCGARLEATRRTTDGVSVWTCFTCGAEAPVASTQGIKLQRANSGML